MGEVIRRTSAVEDIVNDAKTTLSRAQAKGGAWGSLAEERLAGSLSLMQGVEGQLTALRPQYEAAQAVVLAANDHADKQIGRIADETWNAVGRPANDPALAILFPGGIAYYADGDTAEQPARMEVLARLFESGVHPRLDPNLATRFATELRSEAETLASAVAQLTMPAAQMKSLGRVRTSLGRATQSELVNLKRHWRANGQTEAEIHSVIPDRGRETPKRAVEPAPVS